MLMPIPSVRRKQILKRFAEERALSESAAKSLEDLGIEASDSAFQFLWRHDVIVEAKDHTFYFDKTEFKQLKKKGSKAPLWIFIILLIIVLCGGGLWWAMNNGLLPWK